MSDIVARAEAALEAVSVSDNYIIGPSALMRELVAELKSARAEAQRLQQVIASETGFHPSGDCGGDCSGCLEGDEVDA